MGIFNSTKTESKPKSAPSKVKCPLCGSKMNLEDQAIMIKMVGESNWADAYICTYCQTSFPKKR
jgi:DNA-directed RNA polymerase subunit RPC12/RpoP